MKTLRILAAAVIAATSFAAQAVGTLADVSIYDRATGRTLPVQWHDGKYYVVGKPGNEYEIQVRSARGEDLLAVMSVDGVNVLTGQTASSNQGGYVLSAWNRMSIKGWRKSMDEIAAFYFTSLGDSYAARTDRPDNVGVIGVALYQRKRVEPPPPMVYESRPYERNEGTPKLLEKRSADSAGPAAQAMPSAPLGTGHGRREESRTTSTTFERASDHPAETIAIYYDSYRNLVARGVFQAQAPREPNPFPTSFAPDPWR
jgi:hypothetical protein